MPYFEHTFEARIVRHAVGTYRYTVVDRDASLHDALPLDHHARLRIEADVSALPVNGAWQPAGSRWYLMLPKDGMKSVGLRIGSSVEVSFRVLTPDDVDIPAERAAQKGKPSSWARKRASHATPCRQLVGTVARTAVTSAFD